MQHRPRGATTMQHNMDLMDKEDCLIPNSVFQLLELNPGVGIISKIKNAIMVSKGNLDDAAALLEKGSVMVALSKGAVTLSNKWDRLYSWGEALGRHPSINVEPGLSVGLRYTSRQQIHDILQCVQVAYPELQPSFRRFKDLPNEIRIRIWALALPRRRNLFIRAGYNPYKQCAPPTLLSVNKESRDIAQETFRLCVLSHELPRTAVYVNINQDYDRLYIIHSSRGFRKVVEAKVKDRALLKGPGAEFRYSRKTMDTEKLDEPAFPIRRLLSRSIPVVFWYDFTNDWSEFPEKKKWQRVAGRLTRD